MDYKTVTNPEKAMQVTESFRDKHKACAFLVGEVEAVGVRV